MRRLSVVGGALRYEFQMQVQRRSVWVVLMALSVVSVFASFYSPDHGWDRILSLSMKQAVIYWAVSSNWGLSLGFGLLLADRLPRDRRTKMNELFGAFSGSPTERLLGKYLGSMLGTAVPILLCYLVGLVYIVVRLQSIQDLWLALPAVLLITVPSLIFVGAFSLACPAVLWVPLYQFLFIGYYFWGNSFDSVGFSGIPTLSGTVLTPGGVFRAGGFFGVQYDFFIHATFSEAIVSTILMFACAAIALFVLWRYLAWQRARA